MAFASSPKSRPTRGVDLIASYADIFIRAASFMLTATSAVIFLWFGSLKFLGFEQEGLKPIISNNPLISWLYAVFGVAGGAEFLGVWELTTGLLIASRAINPRLSAVGGVMGTWAYFLTITCLITTPGAFQPGYVLALTPAVGAFLIKDIVLFSACLWVVGASLQEIRASVVA